MTAKTVRNGSAGGGGDEKLPRPRALRHVIKEVLKRQAGQEAWLALDADRRAAEEKQFGPLPDRGELPIVPFQEKPFGSPLPRDHQQKVLCRTSSDDKEPTTCDLSSTVVSIALFDGDVMLFACSGVAIPGGKTMLHLTRFVTSSRLVRAFNESRNRDDNLRVAVRLPESKFSPAATKIADGFLGLYDDDIAVVTCIGPRGTVRPLDMGRRPRPRRTTTMKRRAADEEEDAAVVVLLAAGRGFESGTLMATHGRWSEEGEEGSCRGLGTLVVSDDGSRQDHFTEAVLGGPVVGDDDTFLGMITDIQQERRTASFLPARALYDRLKHFQILVNHAPKPFRGYTLPPGVSAIHPSGFMKTIYRLKSYGYPMPPPLVMEFNGHLSNGFEEHFGECLAWRGYPFGDPRGYSSERIWTERLGKRVVADLSRRVVALASFHGCVRWFTCTGLLVRWPAPAASDCSAARTVVLTSASLVRSGKDCGGDVDRSLRIEVFLPPTQRAIGTLEFYSLNYNLAVISLDKKNFKACRPEDILLDSNRALKKPTTDGKKVVAIGRDIRKGLLMASTGEVDLTRKAAKLRYKDVQVSTCKINKVGIGGPLIDVVDGRFVGINFYDGGHEVTPFLPRSKVVEVLSRKKGCLLPSEWGLVDAECIDEDGGGTGGGGEARKRRRKNRWPVPEPYWSHPGLEVSMYHLLDKHRGRVLD